MWNRISNEDARAHMTARGFTPDADKPYPGNHTGWPGIWQPCGHRAAPARANVMSGRRCRECRKTAASDTTRLSDTEARRQMAELGFTPAPDASYVNCDNPWPGTWNECGHTGQPSLMHAKGGRRCATCARIANAHRFQTNHPGRGKRSHRALTEDQARARAAAAGYHPDPDQPYVSIHTPWPGVWAACGHVGSSSVANLRRHGCPTCAPSGYRPTRPGYIYLMARPGEQQVGITNNLRQRIGVHQRAGGWHLIDYIGPMSGVEAQNIERQIKAIISPFRLPGTHENWSTAHLEVSSVRDLTQRARII